MKVTIETLIENYQAGIWWGSEKWLELKSKYPTNEVVVRLNQEGCNPLEWVTQMGVEVEKLCEDSELRYLVQEVYLTLKRGFGIGNLVLQCGGNFDNSRYQEVLINHIKV